MAPQQYFFPLLLLPSRDTSFVYSCGVISSLHYTGRLLFAYIELLIFIKWWGFKQVDFAESSLHQNYLLRVNKSNSGTRRVTLYYVARAAIRRNISDTRRGRIDGGRADSDAHNGGGVFDHEVPQWVHLAFL